jgi:dienelactone hydrolase
VHYKDIHTNEILRGLKQNNSENSREILKYNEWSAEHEHIMAKSFMCSRTTWPGTFVSEDQRALDYLCSRKDVDAKRIGCIGLSGGGLRTNYLAGIDRRIRAAVPVGFMSSWRDFLLKTSYMHSWMTYVPQLPNYLDFPEIIGLRVPLPTLVLNTRQDPLYTPSGMKEADKILSAVYKKAGALKNYKCSFYPGVHKFDIPMQEEAFAWMDRLLK